LLYYVIDHTARHGRDQIYSKAGGIIMKKRILILALAIAFCLGLATPILATEQPHVITPPESRSTVDITNFTGETKEDYIYIDEYDGKEYAETLTFVKANAPATVTVLGEPLLTWDGGAIGDFGSTIKKVKLPENKKLDEIEYLDEVPLATGRKVPGNEVYPDFSASMSFVLPGSTFVLDAGTYSLSSPAGDWVFIVVGNGETQPAAQEPAAPAANTATARPTSSPVLVNGESVAFDAYNIANNNYFKLRDLAFILSGTEKQFEVTWISELNTILLTPGEAYTAVGGEMASKGTGSKTATPTTSKVAINGTGDLGYYQREISLTAYNIGGNNYFKLRDIGQAFDFGVDWDGANNTIVIDTSKGYTPE
jgi:hypothetical protein